jgi:hypothetical protein
MKMTESTNATNFKSSLNEFIRFDATLTIDKNGSAITRSSGTDDLLPLAPPVIHKAEWVGNELILIE